MQPPAPPPILPLASDADDDGVGFVTGAAPSHGGAPRAPRGAAAFDVDAGDLLDWEAYGGACVGWARGGMDRESAGSFMFLFFFPRQPAAPTTATSRQRGPAECRTRQRGGDAPTASVAATEPATAGAAPRSMSHSRS